MSFKKFINLQENVVGFDNDDLDNFKNIFKKNNIKVKDLGTSEIVISGDFDDIVSILKQLPESINCTLRCPTSNYERNTYMTLEPVPMYGGVKLEWNIK